MADGTDPKFVLDIIFKAPVNTLYSSFMQNEQQRAGNGPARSEALETSLIANILDWSWQITADHT